MVRMTQAHGSGGPRVATARAGVQVAARGTVMREVLDILAAGPHTVAAISHRLLRAHGAVGKAVDRLVRDGLVQTVVAKDWRDGTPGWDRNLKVRVAWLRESSSGE